MGDFTCKKCLTNHGAFQAHTPEQCEKALKALDDARNAVYQDTKLTGEPRPTPAAPPPCPSSNMADAAEAYRVAWEAGAASVRAECQRLERELKTLNNPSDGMCMNIAAMREHLRKLERERDQALARVKEMERDSASWQHDYLDALAKRDRLAGDALAELSGHGVATPEGGYVKEPHMLALDIKTLARQRDAARAEVERWKRELDAAVDHCRQKSERIRQLEKSPTQSVCAYCAARFDETGTELISAHVRICEKHPLRAEIARLRAALEDAHAALAWHSSTSPRAADAVERTAKALAAQAAGGTGAPEAQDTGSAPTPAQVEALADVARAAERFMDCLNEFSDVDPARCCGEHAQELGDALARLRASNWKGSYGEKEKGNAPVGRAFLGEGRESRWMLDLEGAQKLARIWAILPRREAQASSAGGLGANQWKTFSRRTSCLSSL
jgi:hypothetical protein